jgi:hypothetical protein
MCECYEIQRNTYIEPNRSNRLDLPFRLVEVFRQCHTSLTIHAKSLEFDNLVQPCRTSPTMERANFL